MAAVCETVWILKQIPTATQVLISCRFETDESSYEFFHTYHKEQVISRRKIASTQSIATTRDFDMNNAKLAGKIVQTRPARRTNAIA